MLKRYFRDILLSIKKQPVSLLINVIGLGTAISISLLSFIYTCSELNMNSYFRQSENIYRLSRNDGTGFQGMPARVGEIVERSIPEILSFCRVDKYKGYHVIKIDNNPFSLEDIICADSSFFRIFDMPFVYGDPNTCLDEKLSMVLSSGIADKYFPGENPVGKAIKLDGKHQFVITGVVQDYENKASITGNAYISLHSIPLIIDHPEFWDSFSSYNYETYLLLDERAAAEEIKTRINDLLSEYGSEYSIKRLMQDEYALTPLKKIYFIDELRPDFPKGNYRELLIIMSSSIIILLIAIINYSILTIIKWKSQIRQLIIRRVLGAKRLNAYLLLLGEAIIISITSVVISLTITNAIIKPFVILLGAQQFENISIESLIPVMLVFALIMGIFSGLYSISVLSVSGQSPSDFLKNKGLTYGKNLITVLSFVQIVTALCLIGCSVVLHKQLSYINNAELGFVKDNIITMQIFDRSFERHKVLKKELLRDDNISNVTFSYSELMANNIRWTFEKDGKDGELYVDYVDNDYIETFGLSICEGNGFSEDQSGDMIIFNRTARERYLSEYPVGSRIEWLQRGVDFTGVIEDVRFQSFYNEAAPMALVYKPSNLRFCNIKLSGSDISSSLDHIENVWNVFFDEYPFEYSFLDDNIRRRYANESGLKYIGSVLSLVSIILVSLGVYTLTSYITESKRTELNVRKVYGASLLQLLKILFFKLNKIFFVAVIPSFIIIYLIMHRWLSAFAYHIRIPLSAFLLSALLVLLVINSSTILKIIKEARVNPADELNK